ncbi:hypothetical protein B0H11DRAFT_2104944 [Mycena galericulata]|nr:hypothetical protein B0H11DRAFT_2104944 [Mycena galericulata]
MLKIGLHFLQVAQLALGLFLSHRTLLTMGDPLRDDSWSISKGVTISVLQNPLRSHTHITGEEPFTIPRHWHRSQDEHHTVLKGRLRITQGSTTKVVGPADGTLVTPAGVVHSISSYPGEEALLEETTVPAGRIMEQKILFFRNIFYPGVLQSGMRVLQVFYYGDTYPELPLRIRWLEWLMVVVVGGWLAALLGYKLPDKRLRMDPKRFPLEKKE